MGFDSTGLCVQVKIKGRIHALSRVIWFYVTGAWPELLVDHRNGDHTDQRWGNLRQATHQINMQNQVAAQKNNASGFLGVFWDKKKCRWRAGIKLKGKAKHLGYFSTPESAYEAYLEAKRTNHLGCTI